MLAIASSSSSSKKEEEKEESNDKAFENFDESIRSKHTKTLYVHILKDFVNRFLKMDRYDYLLPPNMPSEMLQQRIIDYVKELKATGHAPRSIRSYLTAIRFFCIMNNIVAINWFIISRRAGEVHNVTRDRIPSKQELQKLLDKCGALRKRVCFLLMISGGLRVGSLTLLKVGDLQEVRLDSNKSRI